MEAVNGSSNDSNGKLALVSLCTPSPSETRTANRMKVLHGDGNLWSAHMGFPTLEMCDKYSAQEVLGKSMHYHPLKLSSLRIISFALQ